MNKITVDLSNIENKKDSHYNVTVILPDKRILEIPCALFYGDCKIERYVEQYDLRCGRGQLRKENHYEPPIKYEGCIKEIAGTFNISPLEIDGVLYKLYDDIDYDDYEKAMAYGEIC